MGILDFSVGTKTAKGSDPRRSDFEEGLRIVEIVNGKERSADQILLVGTLLPKESFAFGGKQRLKKTFYPGSSEPSFQIFGPEEKPVTIRGTIDLKTVGDASLFDGKESAAVEYQELMDAMRIRGNLVKITLGEWKRYGFLNETTFTLYSLTKIDYEIQFEIAGFNLPKNYYVLDGTDGDVVAPNKALTNKLIEQLKLNENKPLEMDQTLSGAINDFVSDVAAKVALVTNFVDSIVTDAEKLESSAQRALGLIKNARAFISRTNRAIGRIARNIDSLGKGFPDETSKTLAALKNAEHLNKVQSGNRDLNALLAELKLKFASYISTLPLRRHVVVQGETLQKISMKYYGTADNWKKIMDHNKLTSTDLSAKSIIEIPRI